MSLPTNLGSFLTPKNTYASIQICNMICRPAITMSNKEIPEETRKYTASREFCTEALGLMNNLVFVSFIEYIGGQIAAKRETGKILNKTDFKKIKNQTMSELCDKNKKIKAAVFLSSILGSAFSASILTPLLNNLILNKVMKNKEEKHQNEQKLSEITNKVENIFIKNQETE